MRLLWRASQLCSDEDTKKRYLFHRISTEEAWAADPSTTWDPPADSLVATVLANGHVEVVNTMLTAWVHNSDPIPSGLPDGVGDFLSAATQLPSWANQDMLNTAARFNADQGA